MDPELVRALAPLLHDLAVAQLPEPDLRDESWDPAPERASVMLYAPDGSGSGVGVTRGLTAAEQVVDLAEQVQEWAVEELWGSGRPATWPECPAHRNAHPLTPALHDDRPTWLCPVDRHGAPWFGRLDVTGGRGHHACMGSWWTAADGGDAARILNDAAPARGSARVRWTQQDADEDTARIGQRLQHRSQRAGHRRGR